MDCKPTRDELSTALKGLPPVLKPEEVASLLQRKVSTLLGHVSEGRYGGAVRRHQDLDPADAMDRRKRTVAGERNG
jgi:hypothetical protein